MNIQSTTEPLTLNTNWETIIGISRSAETITFYWWICYPVLPLYLQEHRHTVDRRSRWRGEPHHVLRLEVGVSEERRCQLWCGLWTTGPCLLTWHTALYAVHCTHHHNHSLSYFKRDKLSSLEKPNNVLNLEDKSEQSMAKNNLKWYSQLDNLVELWNICMIYFFKYCRLCLAEV